MESFNAYELRIQGLDRLISFAAARWELFAFPEVRDLARGHGSDHFVVFCEREPADPDAWCRLLEEAGYPAEPIGQVDDTDKPA